MKRFGNLLCLLLIAVLFLCSPPPVAGAEGDAGGGNGDGSGGGANSGQALQLSSSSIVDGQSDVPTDAAIDLVFSNNVVNLSIAANNQNCFALRDGQGSIVPVAVVMGDEQVDPTVKRNISIVPVAPLEPGTVYTLLIKQNLSAKNGNTLAGDITITFATAGSKAPAASAEPDAGREKAGEPSTETKAPENAAEETQADAAPETVTDRIDADAEISPAAEAVAEGETNTTPPRATKTQIHSTKLTYVVIGAGVLLAIGFILYFRKR